MKAMSRVWIFVWIAGVSVVVIWLLLTGGGRGDAQITPVAPQQYGAAGDGVRDDTRSVQEAIDRHDHVMLPSGTYRITSHLRLRSGVTVSGPGVLLVDFDIPLDATNSSNNAALYGNGLDNVLLEGFSIRKSFVDGSLASGIVIDNSSNIVMRRLQISGYSARYGIHLIESDNFEISSCYIHDFMVNTATDMIRDSPAGLRVTRSSNGTIANNRILNIENGPEGRAALSPFVPDYGPQGYQADGMTVMDSRYISIVDNVIRNSGEGLDLLVSTSLTVTSNVIRDIWFQGIKMMGTQYSAVSDNVIEDAYQGIGLAYNPVMDKQSDGNTITGNIIRGIGSQGLFDIPGKGRVPYHDCYGIDVPDQSVNNVIAGNVIVDTQETRTMAWGIMVTSAEHNSISGNIVEGGLSGNIKLP